MIALRPRALAELALRAGMPAGIFNLLVGDTPAIGKAMCERPAVRFVGFTGSTEVGKLLMRQAAGTVKKVGLELGGDAPFIVFDDPLRRCSRRRDRLQAPQHSPVLRLRQSHLRAGGRLRPVRFKLTAAVTRLKVGDGTEPGVTQGPLINAEAVEKVRRTSPRR